MISSNPPSNPDASGKYSYSLAKLQELATKNARPPTFNDFFSGVVAYPSLCTEIILPPGWLYTEVSTTRFLNAFLGHAGRILGVYVLACATGWDEILDDPIEVFILDPPDGTQWKSREFATKAELYAIMTPLSRKNNLRLHVFGDDVMLLYYHPNGMYWFFHFDIGGRHTIGRFYTDQPESEVVRLFAEHIQNFNSQASLLEVPEPARSISPDCFSDPISY
jgi:hypothetical protein